MKTPGECYEKESTLSGFRALADMLLSLINFDGDGKMIISKNRPTCLGERGGYIKFVMLSGDKIFSEVCKKRNLHHEFCVPYLILRLINPVGCRPSTCCCSCWGNFTTYRRNKRATLSMVTPFSVEFFFM